MTINGFDILLILVEKIKIDIAQTWEGLNESPVGLKQQINCYDNEGIEVLNEPPYELERE